jgi:succinate dehydrogenase/fumarate reductase flavoprotein subunit
MFFAEKRPWMVPPDPVPEDRIKETFDTEFVIIGAGYAGTYCARKLNESGAKVTLLEKCAREKMRQNIMGGSEYAAFNSKFGFARGIPEYDPIDYILEFQKRTANRCNTDLIRTIAYNSGESFDWFIEPLPQGFKDRITVFNFPGTDLFRGDTNGYKSFAGTMLFDKPPESGDMRKSEWTVMAALMWTLNMIEEKGVAIRYGTAGEYLEKDSSRRVTGVIAKNRDNEYFRFNASKGVVLSAGDFGSNKEMVFDLLDEFSELTQNGTKYRIFGGSRDGSGIRMGIWAGGRMEPGPRGGMYACHTGRAGIMAGAAFLRLNTKGKRYSNEGIAGTFLAGNRGTRQPDGFIASIWDSNWKEEIRYQSYDHGANDYLTNPSVRETMDRTIAKALAEKEQHRANGGQDTATTEGTARPDTPFNMGFPTYAADTFEELADLLGYEGEAKANCLAAIARYNELCRKGRDEDYAKDSQYMHELKYPPYFGTKTPKDGGGLMVTEAGLMVDEHQQVIDDAGDPIPGLFASGQCAGEVFPLQYCPPISGSGIGTCSTLGYALGKYLATL